MTDIAFVVDQSSRVLEDGFELIKEFVWQTIRLFSFTYGETQAALITFADKPSMIFDFPTYRTPEEIHKGIKEATYRGGGTMVHKVSTIITHPPSKEPINEPTEGEEGEVLWFIRYLLL
jgi:hypothetical protein